MSPSPVLIHCHTIQSLPKAFLMNTGGLEGASGYNHNTPSPFPFCLAVSLAYPIFLIFFDFVKKYVALMN